MVIVIMGDARVGKAAIGRALATELGWTFVDADDLRPPPNADTRGASLRALVAHAIDRRESLVLACSPLHDTDRETVRAGLRPVRFVFLEAPELAERSVDEALRIDAAQPPERILAAIRTEFGA